MTDKNELRDRLKAVPLFEGLSDRELRDVVGRGRVVDHSAGRDIVEEGRGPAGFHLILDGDATVIQGGNVRRRLSPGSYFGEVSLLDGKPRSATVRADGELRTFSIVAWDFAPLLDEHPQLARKLLTGLCAQLRAAEAGAAERP